MVVFVACLAASLLDPLVFVLCAAIGFFIKSRISVLISACVYVAITLAFSGSIPAWEQHPTTILLAKAAAGAIFCLFGMAARRFTLRRRS
ncbi:hypothetical protein CJU54_16970 [Pseudomonas aeruginosa]|nr:hypothetical protein F3G61_02130 [Pseudomonas aeruginosa]RTT31441.1 hypothetical protein DY956_24310 [Pseudomonas paraeruginosa]KAB5409688.1 hypothetical protein F8139_23635 [Pseudomonas aeruginosa]KDR48223.1 hypothetical protein DQ20_12855 [Pseudomonas aeruginosa]KSG29728.1 hypothetical protein AO957_24980 [Pseudomonas aeruginosa]